MVSRTYRYASHYLNFTEEYQLKDINTFNSRNSNIIYRKKASRNEQKWRGFSTGHGDSGREGRTAAESSRRTNETGADNQTVEINEIRVHCILTRRQHIILCRRRRFRERVGYVPTDIPEIVKKKLDCCSKTKTIIEASPCAQECLQTPHNHAAYLCWTFGQRSNRHSSLKPLFPSKADRL